MKFIVTAGPTREPIDPVRFLSNRSSGKMGYAIAAAAAEAGHDVTLISGPVCLADPAGVRVIRVLTSDEMGDAVDARIVDADALFMAAAVADFKVRNVASTKWKKHHGTPRFDLIPTRDILATIVRPKKKFALVGFAAETDNVAANAKQKLSVKQCDLIVSNDVSRMDTGFESDENIVTFYFSSGSVEKLPRQSKASIGRELIAATVRLIEKR